jgi:hypothetical protein
MRIQDLNPRLPSSLCEENYPREPWDIIISETTLKIVDNKS